MSLAPGAVLADRYTIVRCIKTGGMGSVYEAVDARLAGTPCAVKEMLEQFLEGEDADAAVRRFSDEMRFLATLSHPNIPHVRDFFTVNRLLYLVMDLIRGDNLEQELTERMALTGGPFPPDLVAGDALQVLDVLQYLHELKPPILHRDIKPANLIREHSTRALKLVDFGLVRADTGSARTHTVVGTLAYAALEQLQGHAEPRSDLYGLGATMHHLLTGIPPRPLAIQPLRQAAPNLDPGLVAIVDRAIAPQPEDRFATARDMRVALEVWKARATETVVRPAVPIPARVPTAPAPTRVDIPRPRRAVWWIPAASAVAAGIAVFALTHIGSTPSDAPSPSRASMPRPVVTVTFTPSPSPTPTPTASPLAAAPPSAAAAPPTVSATQPRPTRVDPAHRARRSPRPSSTVIPYVVNTPPPTTPAASQPTTASAPPAPPPGPFLASTVQVLAAGGQDARLKIAGLDYGMHLPVGWRFTDSRPVGPGAVLFVGNGADDGIMVMVQAADPVLFRRIRGDFVGKLREDGWHVDRPHNEGGLWVNGMMRPENGAMRVGQVVGVPQPVPQRPGMACLFLIAMMASPHDANQGLALQGMVGVVQGGIVHPIQ